VLYKEVAFDILAMNRTTCCIASMRHISKGGVQEFGL